MTRRQRAAERLATGSVVLAGRLWDGACAWCARGRREDLDGWRAVLGVIGRVLLLAFGAYILARLVRALPALMWALTGWWLLASWQAGKSGVTQVPAAPRQAPPDEVYEATLTWIREQIGDRQGVHLRDLLAHAQAHGMFEGLEVSELKGHLERWGVPVRKRVRVRGLGVTVGIHRDDLAAPSGPSPAAAPEKIA